MRDPAFDPPQEPYEAPSPVHNEAARATPSMAQYIEIKAANPDCLLFYRMGDFYELFFADAEIAARTLGIVLTKRGRHAGQDIPMCGVPVVRADEYLQRLIAAGHRVAVCEQLEDPAEARKRGAKAVVRRDVVRIVTPGTITEEGLLDARRANMLVALARQKAEGGSHDYALAAVDISTGECRLALVDAADLAGEIDRLDPSELLVPDALREDPALSGLLNDPRAAVTRLPREGFDPASGESRVAAYYGVATLAGFGTFSRPEIAALAAIIVYLERTQLQARPPLMPPRRIARSATMAIDAATRANLELVRTLGGAREGSLLATIDETVSPGGGRLLAQWLAGPLTDPGAIRARHDAVSALVADGEARRDLRQRLRRCPDMPRSLARLALDRAGPRDLIAIGQALVECEGIAARLTARPDLPEMLARLGHALLAAPAALGAGLLAALREDVPLQKRDGGFIRPGFDAVLDELHALRDNSRAVIAGLQTRYAEETGARGLRIKHNNQLGYFVEVPQAVGEAMLRPPLAATFVHRQTMAGAMRFSTAELSALEHRIGEASGRALQRELDHFAAFAAEIAAADAAIRAGAEALATLDVLAGLAEIADRGGWTRPEITEDATFAIEEGRHPVVERAMQRGGSAFIANPCDLSPEDPGGAGRILLVTGANMAGKSTYLRQNALIAILAQMGAFVPARRARIGIVDRLFSRVGAADDLARGRSTFMVEMVETAAILNQAGPRALVILDEIGRGTATYDGLSIAWAAIEHLHDVNRCRALFATHFHELTALSAKLGRLHPVTMKVATYKGDVVFLHEVVPGAADRSYGIQVAKLAGLPPGVIRRAGAILAELEKADRAAPVTRLVDDLPLFRAVQPPPAPDALRAALDAIRPDEMTPREALDALYRLKALADPAT
ncbi:DNA mismatch repair protein MutS [Rhabdaerophilum calidifontis]|uniref:DNA mismatch repair protein MutS n=1 Tax=Rhabdaerophilum calidifontis TaxID=2604328 RepID=UPI00123859F5